LAMGGIVREAGLELGVPDVVRDATAAYLVVVLESTHADRLEVDTETTAELLGRLGALDVYVLPPTAGADLIAARERAFFVGKSLGANDVVDTVVPRAEIPAFLAESARLAAKYEAIVSGCGHVGDGNVHLSVFQSDDDRRHDLLEAIYRAARDHGGAVSGEHGIGIEKQSYWLEVEDPVKIELMRRIKAAFDPNGILGPGRLFGSTPPSGHPGAKAPAGAAQDGGTTPHGEGRGEAGGGR
ncbi:MAG TPA: FAD-linked oxidase C-terminal domain-containing protein, partial [Acidimicrobiales bacterium]|nr:FAD-linked oxidase C-terminal domain-containing protein [Acidimicrobiales bacterium]